MKSFQVERLGATVADGCGLDISRVILRAEDLLSCVASSSPLLNGNLYWK